MILYNEILLNKKDFSSEKELQVFFESNLKNILNLDFIETEYIIEKYRVDTVAFDNETKSFRIIEYKNVKNRSLVDQGYTYLKLLHERKADFVLKYNEIKNEKMKISDVDWTQSRIIFVSPTFTNYQLDATSFKNLPFDLYTINKYEKDIVVIDSVNKTSDIRLEDINKNFNNDVLSEIKVYSEDDHLNNKPEKIVYLYNMLKEGILSIGDIEIEAKKVYIAFKASRNVVDVEIQKRNIRVNINLKKGELEDPKEITIDQSEIGHWGNGDYRIDINNLEELNYLLYLINQSYEKNK